MILPASHHIPPRQGKAKFPDITLGLVLERGCRGACSGTALCLSMVPPGRKWIFRASRISGSAHFVCFVVPGHVPVPTTRCAVPITRSDNCLCNCNGFRTRNNDSCQKRSSLGVGAIGGCAQQRCHLVCVPWLPHKWCRCLQRQTYSFHYMCIGYAIRFL